MSFSQAFGQVSNRTDSWFPYAWSDVNGDGKQDLITGYGSGIQVFLNHGNGIFTAPQLISSIRESSRLPTARSVETDILSS
jgi:hypothetical protein